MIKIFNEDCVKTMQNMESGECDIILTSPPYNTGKRIEYWSNKKIDGKRVYKIEKRYDKHCDQKTDDEYIKWTLDIFGHFDRVLKRKGCILYNLSYGSESPNLLWRLIADITNKSNFMVADCIVWKKKCAVPNSTSKNKLTRICEFVFVFCRKSEVTTFETNKKVKSVSPVGQKFYEVFYNFVEAKNNDGSCALNKATYSTELCEKLLLMYAKRGAVVYDPFMGSGTTAAACKKMGLNCIGSEISEAQCEFANNRLKEVQYDG